MTPDINVYDSLSIEELEANAVTVLLELSSIVKSNPVSRFSFQWRKTKKRSVRKRIEASPAAAFGGSVSACSSRAAEKNDACGSPDTPLLIPSIEADENLKFSNTKNARKRKNQVLVENVNQLTRNRDSLRKELENVRNYYLKQESLNLQFKALREHLLTSGGIHLKNPPVNGGIFPGDVVDQDDRRQPLISNRTATRAGTGRGRSSYSYGGMEMSGTRHAVVDRCGPLDQIRVAAIARQKRKDICRSKNSKRGFS